MDREIRSYLIDIARSRGRTITYEELNERFHLGYDFTLAHHRKLIGEVLGEISVYEWENDRPLLSSLVIHKGDRDQGDGFYKLCEELGMGDSDRLKRDRNFERDCREECHEFWSNLSNYRAFRDI